MILARLKSLADSTRLRLLAILGDTECTVQELTAILEMGQSRISRHLRILLDAGLVEVRRQGTWSYYRIVSDRKFLDRLWSCLAEEVKALPEVGQDRIRTRTMLELRRRRSQLFFEHNAGRWDQMAGDVLPTVDYRARMLAQIGEVDTLVEVGIGTGSLLPELTNRCRRFIGIDQSAAMLDEARCRMAQEQDARCELRLGEMSHLPLADQSADLVLLNMVLHHAPHPPAVLEEVFRVLGVGGRLVLADLAAHNYDWAREELADQWLGFALSDLRRWLVEAGFDLLREIPLEANAQFAGVLIFLAGKTEYPNNSGLVQQGV